MHRLFVVLLTLSFIGLTRDKQAAAEPYEDPVRVNDAIAGFQFSGYIAVGANGDIAIVYISPVDDLSFRLKRFNAAGSAIGGELNIGPDVSGIGISANGNFGVLRQAPDGSGRGVFVSIYNRAGAIIIPEFRINDSTAGEQFSMAFAMNSNGSFAVVWQDSPTDVLKAKSFNANGLARTSEITIPNSTDSLEISLAMNDLGAFVVVWDRIIQRFTDVDVLAQPFSSSGFMIGSPFRVNPTIPGV